MEPYYKLSTVFAQHEQDVRAVCVVKKNGSFHVCTSSRDRTVRVWDPITGDVICTLHGHDHFVGSVVSITSSPYFPENCIASGGNDKIINVWDLQTFQVYFTLIGHEDVICSLDVSNDGNLLSASWDKTARIWRGNECIGILRGHEHSVWSVLGLPNGDIVTASADKTIKLWRSHVCVQTLRRHSDCVRGLSHLESIGFVSCGNDSLILLWSYGGECLREFHGHTNFIYNVHVGTDHLLSVGEDRTLKIWNLDGNCTQTVVHPGSVWCVSSLPNGDIVTGCSDGVARVWTRDPSRVASQEVLQHYEQALAAQTLPSSSVGEINTEKLPGVEALAVPGSRDQENKVIRNGNAIEAYQWSAPEGRWIKVGEVVDARSSGTKQLLQGKEYDYVFDVDIGDGQMRKLGYNNSENPYATAQDFIWKEQLDQGFLEQIAQFIIANAQPITVGPPSTEYRDPYTGAHAYYTAQPKETPTSITHQFKHFPQKAVLTFEGGAMATILQRLLQLNNEVSPEQQLTSKETEEVTNLTKVLSETSRYHVSKITGTQLALFTNKLLNWPDSTLVPVLDLWRLLVLHPEGAAQVQSRWEPIRDILFSRLASGPVNRMLIVRFLCNACKWERLQDCVRSIQEKMLDYVTNESLSLKNLRLALATLLLNFSVLNLEQKESAVIKLKTLQHLQTLLTTETEEEALYRLLVATGNLIWKVDQCREYARSSLQATLEQCTRCAEQKVKECALELIQYLA